MLDRNRQSRTGREEAICEIDCVVEPGIINDSAQMRAKRVRECNLDFSDQEKYHDHVARMTDENKRELEKTADAVQFDRRGAGHNTDIVPSRRRRRHRRLQIG
jgi:hypothetical protein